MGGFHIQKLEIVRVRSHLMLSILIQRQQELFPSFPVTLVLFRYLPHGRRKQYTHDMWNVLAEFRSEIKTQDVVFLFLQ